MAFSYAEVLEEFDEVSRVATKRDPGVTHWRRRRIDPVLVRLRTKSLLREIDRSHKRLRMTRPIARTDPRLARGWAVTVSVVCPCCGVINHINEGARMPRVGWCCASHPRAPGDHG